MWQGSGRVKRGNYFLQHRLESYQRFREVIRKHDERFTDFELLKRFDLYQRAIKAFVVVVTSEADGNVILKKGPVMM